MKNRFIVVLSMLILLLPFNTVFAQDSAMEIIANSPDHTIFFGLMMDSNFSLTEEAIYFAPTNAAFEALGMEIPAEILDPFIAYHIVVGTELVIGPNRTLERSPVTIAESDMGMMVDQAHVTAEIEARNGKILVIDNVLLTVPNTPAATEGDINAAGSSTVFPLAERMKDEFESAGYASTLSIDSIGSGGGFARFCEEGASDISNASRPIKDGEVESCRALEPSRDPIEFRVGTDALAVTVSADNDFVEDVTLEELAIIFGEAELWSDVRSDWPGEPIERFIPDDASGTFDYFVEEVFEEDPEPIRSVNPTQSSDDNVLVQGIADSPFAIGFFGYAYFAENEDVLRALDIEGVTPNAESVDSNEYPLARPLFMYSTAGIMAEKPQVAQFLAFVLSDVNYYIGEVGYFPASAQSIANAKATLIEVMYGMGDM